MASVRSNTKIRLLIADDHAIFRDGLRKLLDSEKEIAIVGEARNGAECIKKLGELKPDVLLLDLHMPEKDGFAVLEEVNFDMLPTRVIVLTAAEDGFRVFKLAGSNIRAWEPNRDDLPKTLEASIEHLKADRTEQDILFELLLKLGLDLTVPIEQKAIVAKTVYNIGAGTLLVCLAPKVATADVEPLALGIVAWHKQLAPAGECTVVFRDSAFADDVAKTNLTAILQQHGLENVRSL